MAGERHYRALDFVRGFAALAIVFWHYAHFFFIAPQTPAPGFARSAMPLYPVFLPFYEWGYLAVQLFFVVSGFVFFATYSATIADGEINLKRFFVLRLSRLYPLHFVTLIAVLLLQLAVFAATGSYFAYAFNGPKEFVLNVFFVQGWGFQQGFSFNGPSWSVSLELLVYGLFFVVAGLRLTNLRGAAIVVLAGLLLMNTNSPGIGQAIAGFFLGGIVYLFAIRLYAPPRRAERFAAIAGSFVAIAFASLVVKNTDWQIGEMVLTFVVFPAVVLVLALIEVELPKLFVPFRRLGDITYGTYLLHFPVQLAIVLVVALFGLKPDYRSPLMLGLYVGLVILIAIPTYSRFERPMQSYLRGFRFTLPLRRRFGIGMRSPSP